MGTVTEAKNTTASSTPVQRTVTYSHIGMDRTNPDHSQLTGMAMELLEQDSSLYRSRALEQGQTLAWSLEISEVELDKHLSKFLGTN